MDALPKRSFVRIRTGVHKTAARLLTGWRTARKQERMFDDVACAFLNTRSLRRKSSGLSAKQVRLMGHLGLYEFKTRLKRAAANTFVWPGAENGIVGVTLEHVEETFTMACCNWCGTFNSQVGAADVHVCTERTYQGRGGCSRDGGASRNILFKVPHILMRTGCVRVGLAHEAL